MSATPDDIRSLAWQWLVDAGISTWSNDCAEMADRVMTELRRFRPADVTRETVRAIVRRLIAEYEDSVLADMLQGEIYPELAGFMAEAASV
jgi:hypothetical protein